jgi:hypothetical protein
LFIYAKDLFVAASHMARPKNDGARPSEATNATPAVRDISVHSLVVLVAGFDRSLVALAPVRDLLFCAKLLFVAASDRAGEANGPWAARKGAVVTHKPSVDALAAQAG